MRRTSLAFSMIVLAAGCDGGDGYLDQSTVTSLPNGDAVGTDVSGQYSLELYTVQCSGTCSVDYGQWTVSVCDIGDIDNETVTVTQTDGHLQVDSNGGLFVDRMIGGIWADGTFDVGGYQTEGGGDTNITSRAEGTINADGQLTADARAHGWGNYEGQSFNCTAIYDVTGQRLGF